MHPDSRCSISIFFYYYYKKSNNKLLFDAETRNQTDLTKTVLIKAHTTKPCRSWSICVPSETPGSRDSNLIRFFSLSSPSTLALLPELPALLPLAGFILSGQLFPQDQSMANDKNTFYRPQGQREKSFPGTSVEILPENATAWTCLDHMAHHNGIVWQAIEPEHDDWPFLVPVPHSVAKGHENFD